MKVTFKYVGQGDSIILEWEEGGKNFVGIVDCNKDNSSNPILDYLKNLKNYSFEFLILSHPHTDHFSGILEILEYVETANIPLRYFLHTCASQKNYLRFSVTSITHKRLLEKIFIKTDSLHKSGLLNTLAFVNNFSRSLSLGSNFVMSFIAPTQSHYDKFNQKAFKNDVLSLNNPDANWLSTMIKIYSRDAMILLTSDVNYDVFWEFNRKNNPELKGPPLALGQVSHHGSIDSFFNTFWRVFPRSSSSFGCISVGPNTYGHPGKQVIQELQTFSYTVHQTYPTAVAKSSKPHPLDSVSTVVKPLSAAGQDLSFEIIGNLITKV
jgi:competence protein ComEC